MLARYISILFLQTEHGRHTGYIQARGEAVDIANIQKHGGVTKPDLQQSLSGTLRGLGNAGKDP